MNEKYKIKAIVHEEFEQPSLRRIIEQQNEIIKLLKEQINEERETYSKLKEYLNNIV
jgi:hypothetical protein